MYLVGHLEADILLHPDDRVLGQGILVHQMVQLENTVGEKVGEGVGEMLDIIKNVLLRLR